MIVNPVLPVSVSIAGVPSGAICAGTSVIFTATPTNGGTTPVYQWKKGGVDIPGATSSTYTSASLANGDVITCVLISNLPCPTGSPATSNAITMTVNPLTPVSLSIDALPSGAICAGTPVTFTATPTNGGTTPVFQWRKGGIDIPGATSSIYTSSVLTNSDVITCIMTSSIICPTGSPATSNAINMIVSPVPTAAAANNGPVCTGTPLTLTGGPAGMAAYAWTGPNGFISSLQSPTISSSATTIMAGLYTLTVTNSFGCRSVATTTVIITVSPDANAGSGGNECDLNFALNAVPSVGAGTWTSAGPGRSTFSPNAHVPDATVTVSAYGSYTFTWTELNGTCSSSSTVSVNFYRQPNANSGPDGNECDLNHVLSAVSSVGIGTWIKTTGPGTAIFTPDATTPDAIVTVSAYGNYTFTWTEVNGPCSNSSTVAINFYQQPVANAGTGGNNCGDEFNLRATPSVGTGTWTRLSGPGNATFNPNVNSSNAKVTITAYGTYVFRWTEVNGTCSSNATVSVTFIQQPSANGGNGGNECDKDFLLNAVKGTVPGTWSKVKGPGNVTFVPNPNTPNARVTVTQFGAYDFAWTEVNNLCSSTDIIRVTFNDLPTIDAGADALVCKGSTIQLHAAGAGSFFWTPTNLLNDPNIYNPVAAPSITSVFKVTLTDQYGCKNSDQVTVEVREKPVANAGSDQVLEYLFETYLEAILENNYETGKWTVLSGTGTFDNQNNPVTKVSDLSLEENTFIWSVDNGVCPVSADTVNIIVHNLVIPTLITSNLDGKNDFFIIHGVETFGKTELVVFNRWGAQVYKNSNYDNSWDGLDDNAEPLPDDTYFFVLKPEKTKPIRGFVVLRR